MGKKTRGGGRLGKNERPQIKVTGVREKLGGISIEHSRGGEPVGGCVVGDSAMRAALKKKK